MQPAFVYHLKLQQQEMDYSSFVEIYRRNCELCPSSDFVVVYFTQDIDFNVDDDVFSLLIPTDEYVIFQQTPKITTITTTTIETSTKQNLNYSCSIKLKNLKRNILYQNKFNNYILILIFVFFSFSFFFLIQMSVKNLRCQLYLQFPIRSAIVIL